MKFNIWWLGIVVVTLCGVPARSHAFDIQLTQEQVKEANVYGAQYKGKEIFESPIGKSACFGEYPGGNGGFIMSKYMRIAVNSAMRALKNETLTLQDLKEIETSKTFNVIVSIPEDNVQTPEDVQIMLIQGTNNILPQKTEFGMKYKDKRQGVIGIFSYDKINPKASTAIIVKAGNDEKKFKIDFSDVK
ncbi:hypothetical protein BIY37_02745 [Candidatus Brocadia sapporoensis]|uniref:Uncharacterized protein n=1 Tax=Candidatus Brocadia sapporoensis TaxID=392547 RepID=A0A1V6M2B5_9BACT|nr:hypothetical protein [Candidatus Brocadia sapporoensis]MDG6005690.1 hypothetical protein [Candidatus Brocadia sp.]OQD46554.1 hypothetical protein BIY37_02745 [Candidatus Brocadia sapporoensis]GJQ22728.1 MAG: hypothetical protein HBSAPP01_05180 [Candidatus Brocadia sapporoensis]